MGNISLDCALCLDTANMFNKDSAHEMKTLVYPTVEGESTNKEENEKNGKNQKNKESQVFLKFQDTGVKLKNKITLKDIHIKRDIGRGAFGKVVLVRIEGIPDMLFAMKIIKKPDVMKMKLSKCITLEKEILKNNTSPFLVKLYFAFQSNSKLYLIMEYVAGGDFFRFLKMVKKLPEEVARFYLAEIILALEYLHEEMGIIYRDLKPENILITENGHIKLTDFGLSREDSGDALTFAGTAEYTAPEIIKRNKYSRAVDYWSLGVLAYEMMAGHSPFCTRNGEKRNVHKIHNNIVLNTVIYPEQFSPEATGFIKNLLVADPSLRFSGGFPEMKAHPFFAKIDWELMEAKKVVAPIKMRPKPQKLTSIVMKPSQNGETNCEKFPGFSHIDSLEEIQQKIVI